MCFQIKFTLAFSLIVHSEYMHDIETLATESHHEILQHANVTSNINSTELIMKYKGIKVVTVDAFKGLINLKYINLAGNNIIILKAEIFKDLNALKELDLSYNKLCEINGGIFKYLSSLEKLDLSSNYLKEINGDTFLGLGILKILRLGHNDLCKLKDRAFRHLALLQHLNLEANDLKELNNKSFVGLSALQMLNLWFNKISELQNGTFQHLTSLERLNLEDNALVKLNSQTFFGLESLKIVHLERNALSGIETGTFKYTTFLERLNLNGNGFRELNSKLFVGLESLKVLNLTNNEIYKVQNGTFTYLVSLAEVNLDRNALVELNSMSLLGLKELTKLNLGHNKLCKLENGTFKHLISLQNLICENNELMELCSQTFFGLKSLQSLNLRYNKLKVLKHGNFKHLISLEELNLNNNALIELSSGTFLNLSSLKVLYLPTKLFCHSGKKNLKQGIFSHLSALHYLDLSGNCLKELNPELLLGLASLKVLGLMWNELYHIENATFRNLMYLEKLELGYNALEKIHSDHFLGLISLKELSFRQNKLYKLENRTFKHIAFLEILDLSQNFLTKLNREIFQGVKFLSNLDLFGNKLKDLGDKTFRLLPLLQTIKLDKNYLVDIYFLQLPAIKLHHISIASNNLVKCTFSNLKSVKTLGLHDNGLVHIAQSMLAGMRNLTTLSLSYNYIQTIDQKAFIDLVNLKALHLSGNKLTNLTNEMFTGLANLKLLDLSRNSIHTIEHNAFAHVLLVPKELKIDLKLNKVSQLMWSVFLSSNSSYNAFSVDQFNKVTLVIDARYFKCRRSLCWMKHLKWKNIFTHLRGSGLMYNSLLYPWINKNDLKIKCDGVLKSLCPSKDWCMMLSERNKCEKLCRDKGQNGGELLVDGDVCPFQYFCRCTCHSCPKECASREKIHVQHKINMFGCSICNCQCRDQNCWKICNGNSFKKQYNIFGCQECKCKCDEVECDAKCGGKGLGLFKINKQNCTMCAGCKIQVSYENNSEPRNKLIPILVSLLFLACLLSVAIFYLHRRKTTHNNERSQHSNTALDILTKNLHPDLTQVVKENWIEPKSFSVQHFVGHGNFGLVWSGLWLKEGQKFQVAIKVGKGEYKEVWAVETRWNSKHELKPQFEKRPVEIEFNNQIINDLLVEASLLRTFDHSNIMSIYGISIYEEKPCIILPFMSNGDLQKYLKTNYKWSYGIVLWEIFSFGQLPYTDIENTDVLKYLTRGHRLEKPAKCPDNIYKLMLKCWETIPEERPLFNTLVEIIDKIAEREACYTEVRDESTSQQD